MQNGIDLIHTSELAAANARAGGHWFEPGALRFFRSRVAECAYQGPGGTYFVSSERFVASNGYTPGRAYSVRRFDHATGSVDTVGAFQAYAHRSTADRRARNLARGGE